MESLKTAFCEDATYLYIALVVAELILAAVWYERRTHRTVMLLAIPPVLAVAVFAVEAWVVTDREKILAAAGDIARCVETGNYAGIPEHLHEDFVAKDVPVAGTITRAVVERACESIQHTYPIKRIKLRGVQIEITGTRASMHVRTVVYFGSSEESRADLAWDLEWIKVGDRWLLREVDPPQMGL